jgi:hypothetical protein
LKISESKNCGSSFLRKKSESDIHWFQLFQKYQRTGSFYEKLAKNQWLEKWVFEIVKDFANQGSIPNPVFKIFFTPTG